MGFPVIADYIFDEAVTVILVRTRNIKLASELGEELLDATMLVRIDEQLFSLSGVLFRKQEEPSFSFTDCSSVAACKANGVSNIATFDEDFKGLEGFNIVG